MSTQPQVQPQPATDTPGSTELILPTESWSDEQAYKIALSDFRYAESYRQLNHDRRYKVSDDLFMAATVKKYWEGTKIQRSSMPVFLALQQIEGMLPHVVAALFNDDIPFAARPMPGSTPDQARSTAELIAWQLSNLGQNPHEFLSLRELFRLGYKSDLIYGNQIIEWGWHQREDEIVHYNRTMVPERRMIPHPAMPTLQVPVPTGRWTWQVEQHKDKQRISKPYAEHVDIRDFYWDPNCPSQNIQKARYAARRQFPTLSELWAMREIPGFKIPDAKALQNLCKKKSMREGDSSKRWTETSRGNTWTPTLDYSDDPAIQRVEVVRYIRKDRCVWIVPGADKNTPGFCLYNQPNEYQMINFLTSSYTDVPGRWAGLSICDLVEGDQHLAMSILDARIDWLNLWGVNKPIVRRRGSISSPTQKRLRPGAEWETDGQPKDDIMFLDTPDVTAQAFVEVDAIDRRVQKTTGNSDLAVIGTPSAGGNSANRSATGVQVQQQASGSRIQYQVENKEDHILVPLLYIIHWLDKRFLNPEELTPIMGRDGQFIAIDHVDVLNSDVQFRMLGSSKMKTKQALQAGGLNVILESVTNPALVSEMKSQGLKPNMAEVDGLICDTLNLRQRTLWIPMSPQEMQMAQQQSMMPDLIRMQMQRERMQSAERNQDESNETKLLQAVIAKLLTPDVAHTTLELPSPAAIEHRDNPKPPPRPAAGGK